MIRATALTHYAALIVGLVAMHAPCNAATPPATTPGTTMVSFQVVNPDPNTAVRLLLDNQVIAEGLPARSTASTMPTQPTIIGPIAMTVGTVHSLSAEVPGTPTRARLVWTPQPDGSAWVVVHYYGGREVPATAAFFTFALQSKQYLQH